MTIPTSPVRWLDFSGAPPIVIPRSIAPLWRGTSDPATGEDRELNVKVPITDYDHACAAAWPGRSALKCGDTSVLALYTEFDLHTWDISRNLVAGGNWLPSDDDLRRGEWTDSINWETEYSDFFLMNSAANGRDLRNEDYLLFQLAPGKYTVDYCDLEAESVGCFHRFTLVEHGA